MRNIIKDGDAWSGPQTTMNPPKYAKAVDAFFRAVVSVIRIAAYPGICNICGHSTLFVITNANLRENVICIFCRSFNRARQMYRVFSMHKTSDDIRIWNMENSGSLHAMLVKAYGSNYVYSAYFGKGIKSGTLKDNVRHEDVRKTSFPSDHFDFILSSDVLEHVPKPGDAFIEMMRILKPGGKFIFTVPFIENREASDRRAIEDETGGVVLLKEPQYHGDPLNPDGILVFTLFGWDILEMARSAGLACYVRKLYMLRYGIIGSGNSVFMAVKPGTSVR